MRKQTMGLLMQCNHWSCNPVIAQHCHLHQTYTNSKIAGTLQCSLDHNTVLQQCAAPTVLALTEDVVPCSHCCCC